jgi:hypothetical protein
MTTQITPAQRAAILKVAVSLRDDFRKRTREWGWHAPDRDADLRALQTKHKLPALKATASRLEKPYRVALAKVEDVERTIRGELDERQHDYIVDIERQFAGAVIKIAAATTAEEASAAVNELL